MTTTTEMTATERAAAFLSANDISVTAVFVPFSKSRNKANKHKSLNWVVTILYKGREILTTDYSAGMAHCPAYKARHGVKQPPRYAAKMRDQACAWECENGRAGNYIEAINYTRAGKPIMPDSASVFYSVLMDSSVLDESCFEDWASSTGYDADSRSAETIYRACLEIALKMRNGFGEKLIAEAREAFQDY